MRDSSKDSLRMKWYNRVRTVWWKHLQPLWQEVQWPVIGGLALVALGLGYVGFGRHFAALGETRPPLDLFYLALQLFVLGSGSISGSIHWELEVARLMAPAVTGYTATKALAVLFREQLERLRLRFLKGHVVICGLDRKGLLLAKAFHQRGYPVVVIEKDETNGKLAPCREEGATVLIGDATDRSLLRKARVHKAAYLISVCGDDGANAEVAVHARALVGDRKGRVLTCLVHIFDSELCDLLREQEIETQKADSFRLEFFNVFDSGARALLNAYPAFSQSGEVQGDQAHLLVVGLGRMGESLVVQAARKWWAKHRATGNRLRITIVDRTATLKKESLCLRYPRLDATCDLIPQDMDVSSPEFQRAAFLFNPHGHCTVTTVYVCLDDDSRSLSAALTLLRRVREHGVPIVAQMTQEVGLATLLRGEDGSGGGFDNLHGFGLLDRACKPDLLLGGTHEILARAIHEDYVRNQEKQGQTPDTNPSMVAWDKLPESLKESNRRQADHIGVKLQAVGCMIVPQTDWGAELFTFSPEEVELMAEMEHERWVTERRLAGWTYGPERDLEKKTSPYLVPWDQLPENVKEYDRNTVRNLPAFLAEVGFEVKRVPRKDRSAPEFLGGTALLRA